MNCDLKIQHDLSECYYQNEGHFERFIFSLDTDLMYTVYIYTDEVKKDKEYRIEFILDDDGRSVDTRYEDRHIHRLLSLMIRYYYLKQKIEKEN